MCISFEYLINVCLNLNSSIVCNDYDMCTFNKMVNYNQLTVQFHVNDLKASHHNPDVLQEFVKQLCKEFGNEYELIKNIGKLYMTT